VFGHTHSAYTHLAGKHLAGYNIEVLRITRHPRLKGDKVIDEITGQFIDESDQNRPAVPFTLSTHDSYLTDPAKLDAIFEALQAKLNGGASHIELIYLHERQTMLPEADL
jgi:hypothetical protein